MYFTRVWFTYACIYRYFVPSVGEHVKSTINKSRLPSIFHVFAWNQLFSHGTRRYGKWEECFINYDVLFVLRFYAQSTRWGHVSVNLTTLLLGRLSPLSG